MKAALYRWLLDWEILNLKRVSNKVCLYRHLKPNGEVFYIGIGSIYRANDKYRRSKFWKSIVSKYGYEVQILKNDLDLEEAIELEKILIAYYGRRDLKQGTLVNMTDGGEGVKGLVITDDIREMRRRTCVIGRNTSKIVINTKTGVEYKSLKEAAEKEGILYPTLRRYMCGLRKNKTSLIYKLDKK